MWLPLGASLFKLARWQPQIPVPPEQKIPLLLSLYWLAPLVIWFYARWGEKAPLATYGIVWNAAFWSSLVSGFTLGGAGIGVLLLLKRSLGWLTFFEGKHSISQDFFGQLAPLMKLGLPILALALVISWVEEVVFRGFVVNQLHLAYGWIGVVILASLIFAILHLVWDGPVGIPQLPGLMLMGAVLILARWVDTGLLGLCTGLHAGWIFTLALTDTLKLVNPVATSPRWLAGQPDQPLTGLVDIGLLLTTAGLLWVYGSYW